MAHCFLDFKAQHDSLSPCYCNARLDSDNGVMQSTIHHIQKRTVGEAAVKFGKFVFASGRQAFMWNRGRVAMNSVLKDAVMVSSKTGITKYIKYGGTNRALQDFFCI